MLYTLTLFAICVCIRSCLRDVCRFADSEACFRLLRPSEQHWDRGGVRGHQVLAIAGVS